MPDDEDESPKEAEEEETIAYSEEDVLKNARHSRNSSPQYAQLNELMKGYDRIANPHLYEEEPEKYVKPPETPIEFTDKLITPEYRAAKHWKVLDPSTRKILLSLPEIFTHDLPTSMLEDYDRELLSNYHQQAITLAELILDGIMLESTMRDCVNRAFSIVNVSKAKGDLVRLAMIQETRKHESYDFPQQPPAGEALKQKKRKPWRFFG